MLRGVPKTHLACLLHASLVSRFKSIDTVAHWAPAAVGIVISTLPAGNSYQLASCRHFLHSTCSNASAASAQAEQIEHAGADSSTPAAARPSEGPAALYYEGRGSGLYRPDPLQVTALYDVMCKMCASLAIGHSMC